MNSVELSGQLFDGLVVELGLYGEVGSLHDAQLVQSGGKLAIDGHHLRGLAVLEVLHDVTNVEVAAVEQRALEVAV